MMTAQGTRANYAPRLVLRAGCVPKPGIAPKATL